MSSNVNFTSNNMPTESHDRPDNVMHMPKPDHVSEPKSIPVQDDVPKIEDGASKLKDKKMSIMETFDQGVPYDYDPRFKGPIHNRSCTDLIWCIVFVIFLIGMGIISFYAFVKGDPRRVLYPTDSNGDLCGEGKYEDKPYLFFFDMMMCVNMGSSVTSGCPTKQVCVKECPKKNFVYLLAIANNDTSSLICTSDVDFSKSPYKEMSVKQLVEDELCAAYYLKSDSVVHRCIPKISSKHMKSDDPLMDDSGQYQLITAAGQKLTIYNESIFELYNMAGSTVEMVFKDVVNSCHLILACLAIAAVLALLWIVLLRRFTVCGVWLLLLALIGILGFCAGYSFYKYFDMKDVDESDDYKKNQDNYTSQRNTWLAFGIMAGGSFVIVILFICCLYSRIMFACRLISETSVAMGYMWSVLLWPIIPFFLDLIVIAFCIASVVFISSLGDAEYYTHNLNAPSRDTDRVSCHPVEGSPWDECYFVHYGGKRTRQFMMVYMLFMYLWLTAFVSALNQMTLAGSFASYYWAWDKERDVPKSPLWSSLDRNVRYHLGSMALGSLIIAIIQFIRFIVDYVRDKMEDSDNDLAAFLLCMIRCILSCLEGIVRYINKNAYIMISIHGNNFCSAAKDAFRLILRNFVRAIVVDRVCTAIMFVSKLMVAAAVGAIAFFLFKGDFPLFKNVTSELNYYLVPVILSVIGAFWIADSFFDVFSMGVDTLFLCYLEDLERNDGSPEKPYYMSKCKNPFS